MSVQPGLLHGPYKTVLDVGAFRGDFARACLKEWPLTSVLSFEPLEPEPGDTGTGQWAWFPCALGEREGVVTIHRNEFVPSSSILPMANLHAQAFPYTKTVTEAQVGVRRLDEYIELVDEPALLKIDVQGYEAQVLKGAGQVLKRCAAVVLEVSWETLYHGAPSPAELRDDARGQRVRALRSGRHAVPPEGPEAAAAVGRAVGAAMSTALSLRDYSQSAEQATILNYVGDRQGRFLDIGAGDGETFSNTRALALQGWGGVAVEPAPWALEKLVDLYADTMVLPVAAAVTPALHGIVRLAYSPGDHLTSVDPRQTVKWRDVAFKTMYAAAVPLAQLLDQFGPFEVVSIDAEGLTLDLVRAYQRHPMWSMVRVIVYELEAGDNLKLPAAEWSHRVRTPNNVVYAR